MNNTFEFESLMEFEKIYKYQKKKIRFLIVGFVNTCFGYGISIINYYLFYEHFGLFFYSLLNHILSITFSFVNYKYFVFLTKNIFFFREYLRSFLVYSLIFTGSTILIFIFLEILFWNIYVSQALNIIIFVPISYMLNSHFTFKKNR